MSRAEGPRRSPKCGRCLRQWSDDLKRFNDTWTCRCGAPICVHCWSSGLRTCAEHAAGGKPETGKVSPSALAPEEAIARETHFLERLENAVARTGKFWHPSYGKGIPLTRDMVTTREETYSSDFLRKLIRKHCETGLNDTFARMPKNRGVVMNIHRREMFRKKVVGSVLGLCVSPLKDLVMRGWSDRSLGMKESAHLMDTVLGRVSDHPSHYSLVVLFSTTGWTDQALKEIPVGDDFVLGLSQVRQGVWQFFPSGDPMWKNMKFTFSSEDEKLAWIRDHVQGRAADVLLERLTDAVVARDLNIPLELVQSAFESISEADPFLELVENKGMKHLIRKY